MAGSTFKKLGATVHGGSSVAAGDDILASGTIGRNGVLHIQVAVDTDTILAVDINDGSTDEEVQLNGGVALQAGVLHTFPILVEQGFNYTLINATSVGTSSTIAHASLMLECPVG